LGKAFAVSLTRSGAKVNAAIGGAVARLFGRSSETWLIVGDSHTKTFREAEALGLIRRRCKFVGVSGATAVGLRNPNSQTNAIAVFKEHMLPAQAGATPVIQLGEVDCGFVIWYRAEKHNEPVEKQLQESIAAYFEFVDELRQQGYPEVVISAATMPTIQDGQDWGEVANLRKEVTATLQQRTELTLDYNRRLKAEAEARGLPFIDISQAVLDPATGVIAERFRNPDPLDHHLDTAKAGKLWAEELNRIGELQAERRAN
jgi:hypothetical protein